MSPELSALSGKVSQFNVFSTDVDAAADNENYETKNVQFEEYCAQTMGHFAHTSLKTVSFTIARYCIVQYR